MKRASILFVLFAFLFLGLLSACGGGGGENSSPADPTNPPEFPTNPPDQPPPPENPTPPPSTEPLANWHLRSSLPGGRFNGVIYGNGIFVAVGDSGILTSPDGTKWSSINSAIALKGVTYANRIFVAVGGGGVILTSPDGVAWTSRYPGISGYSLNGVTYGNGKFVAVGGNMIRPVLMEG